MLLLGCVIPLQIGKDCAFPGKEPTLCFFQIHTCQCDIPAGKRQAVYSNYNILSRVWCLCSNARWNGKKGQLDAAFIGRLIGQCGATGLRGAA